MDESTEMPISETPTTEVVKEWASDWAGTYDQDWDWRKLTRYVSKTISAHVETDDGPRGFKSANIVGYSEDRIFFRPSEGSELEVAKRCSFLTDDGKQLPIFAGMEIIEDDE